MTGVHEKTIYQKPKTDRCDDTQHPSTHKKSVCIPPDFQALTKKMQFFFIFFADLF